MPAGCSNRKDAGTAVQENTPENTTKKEEKCPLKEKNWDEDEIKKVWEKTETGKKVLEKLPESTTFKSYKKSPGDKRNAYYSPKENAIYIPSDYTSKEAAPTTAHEATHAYQKVVERRPKDKNDLIEMEVEAKNKGLNVYEEMGKPKVPYNYEKELEFRSKSPDKYNDAVRETYKKVYNVK